jgi:hypothetical protein
VAAVVQRPGDRALVVADPAVVGPGQQVGRLGRVVSDVVLGVAPERAVLVDPDIAVGVAVGAAKGAAGDADVAFPGLGGDRPSAANSRSSAALTPPLLSTSSAALSSPLERNDERLVPTCLPFFITGIWGTLSRPLTAFCRGACRSRRGRQPGLRVPVPARDRGAAGGGRGDQVDRSVWDGATARQVVLVGNPLVWWGFLAGLPVCVYRVVRHRAWPEVVVLGGSVLLYGPWLVIPRTPFLFYMVPVVPFMALGLVAVLRSLPDQAHGGSGRVWAWPRCWRRWRTRQCGSICRCRPAGCGSSRSSPPSRRGRRPSTGSRRGR